jgi:hypothetical protein
MAVNRIVPLSIVGLCAAVVSVTTLAAQPPDIAAALTGGWRLNADASLNPDGVEAGVRGRGLRTGPDRGPNRTGVGSGPPPGGDLGAEEAQRMTTHLRMLRPAPDQLGIQATPKEVLMIFDPDPAKKMAAKYTTDNKKHVQETSAGPLEIKVKWQGRASLRREITSRESLKVVEDYTPSADGKQLVVTVKISSAMARLPNVEIKRVYDRMQ